MIPAQPYGPLSATQSDESAGRYFRCHYAADNADKPCHGDVLLLKPTGAGWFCHGPTIEWANA